MGGDAAGLLVGGGAVAGEAAEGLVQRAAQECGAHGLAAVERPGDVAVAGCACGLVGCGAVGPLRHHGDGRGPEAVVGQHLADLVEMLGVALEDRDLEPVIARALELPEQRKMLLGDVGGPEEEVEAHLHRRSFFVVCLA